MKPALLLAHAEALLDSYRRHFSNLGYEVETATGGLAGLAKLGRFMPDVFRWLPSRGQSDAWSDWQWRGR